MERRRTGFQLPACTASCQSIGLRQSQGANIITQWGNTMSCAQKHDGVLAKCSVQRRPHQAYSRAMMKAIVGLLLKKCLAYARAFGVSASECSSANSCAPDAWHTIAA
eukprot:1140536-Pelagomonas_calceolata.AAC.10